MRFRRLQSWLRLGLDNLHASAQHTHMETTTANYLTSKVRKHRFEGHDPSHCDRCGDRFSSVTHK